MKRPLSAVALTSIITWAAACNPGFSRSETADTSNSSGEATIAAQDESPCALVTSDEISTVLGKPVTRQEEPSANRCIFYTEDPLVFVDLEIDQQNAAEAWKGVSAGNEIIGASEEAVAALGENAFFGPRDRLYVLHEDAFLAIEAGFDDKVRERAMKVATLALGKLR